MEDDYKLFEPITPKVEPTKNPVYGLMKSVGKSIISDTPTWAKVVRLVGIGVLSLGLSLQNPPAGIALFTVLAPYAGVMQWAGNFGIIFAQLFSKKQ